MAVVVALHRFRLLFKYAGFVWLDRFTPIKNARYGVRNERRFDVSAG
ncbi:hypothetical protein [Paenibacillus dendritiformis]